ncbi:pectate lyase [Aphelenchoides avenae]|nr:pectate lyase [Aphelenchus avenae]
MLFRLCGNGENHSKSLPRKVVFDGVTATGPIKSSVAVNYDFGHSATLRNIDPLAPSQDNDDKVCIFKKADIKA